MDEELIIYSNEPLWEDLYDRNFNINNGTKLRLANINRGNNKNVIYVDMKITGKAYINIYRGYKNNGKLIYEISNHQLVDGDGVRTIFKFQDFTESDKRYINYYVEVEALESISFRPYATGLIFDDILSSTTFSQQVNCNLVNDINSKPLNKQIYNKNVNFSLIINRGFIQQVSNVIEKPYYFINKDGCLDNTTRRLANVGISTKYVTSHTKYVEMVLTNIEEI